VTEEERIARGKQAEILLAGVFKTALNSVKQDLMLVSVTASEAEAQEARRMYQLFDKLEQKIINYISDGSLARKRQEQ
jgi:hypothetical protein